MSKRILFIIAAIVLAAAGIFFRAANAHTARAHADQIVQDDIAGKDTAAGIASLKDYVKTHMGGSVSFTLTSSYNREASSAAQSVAASSNATTQIYADAQRACSGKSDSITQAKCNQAYLSQHLTAQPTPAPPIPAPDIAKYQYKLTAPQWTPDLAGALLLGALASVVLGLLPGLKKGRR